MGVRQLCSALQLLSSSKVRPSPFLMGSECALGLRILEKPQYQETEAHNMQASGQLELAGEVVPLLAKIPSAEARTQAQAHVWGAVVELDLATRAARRCGEKGIPAVELRNTLTHPFVLDCISAKNEGRASLHSCRRDWYS